jgi:replicative DNA helicase
MSDEFKKERRKKAELADQSAADTLPPHSIEAEQGVLGCVILSPSECLIECIEKFKGNSRVFYDLRHQVVFEVMLLMHEKAEAIDLITLQQKLRTENRLDDAGGLPYLASLPDTVPSAANLGHYLGIVCEKFVLRRLAGTCADVLGRIRNYEGDVDSLFDQVERDILKVGDERMGGVEIWETAALVDKTADALEHIVRAAGIVEIPTGYACWDRLSGGLHKKELVLIGGRPGTGKTSLAMCLAENIAIPGRKPVGVLSLEMSAQDLMLRLLCSRARVNFHKLRTGFPEKGVAGVSEGDVAKLNLAGQKIRAAGIYIDETPNISLLQVRSKLRQMKQRYGIRVAFIDFAQLIAPPRGLEDNPVAAGTEMAKGLKNAAKELDIPIVVLCQLNREAEKRGGRPRMSDLRESGGWEQAADFIGILFRKELPEEEEAEMREKIRDDPMGNTELQVVMEVCKQRSGPTGDIFFNFKRWCMRFEDEQRPSKPDEPL